MLGQQQTKRSCSAGSSCTSHRSSRMLFMIGRIPDESFLPLLCVDKDQHFLWGSCKEPWFAVGTAHRIAVQRRGQGGARHLRPTWRRAERAGRPRAPEQRDRDGSRARGRLRPGVWLISQSGTQAWTPTRCLDSESGGPLDTKAERRLAGGARIRLVTVLCRHHHQQRSSSYRAHVG